MSKIYNISNWNIKRWISTGGTRAKCFIEDPSSTKEYFFKESIEKFPSEFWSEIIASKVGKYLGFRVLDYNIGILKDTVGCLCESMIDQSTEELDHGINLIKNSIEGFKVNDRPVISFSDVATSFANYKGFILKFIDVMIFDAIIGNQDRHSENWAIIRSLDTYNEKYNTKKLAIRLYELYKRSGFRLKRIPFKNFFIKYMNKAELVNIDFSPIYDNGSSLGREIPEEKIQAYLDNKAKIIKYISNGKSEIRWNSEITKINHFQLLKNIQNQYPKQIYETILRVIKKYKREEIESIINQIDKDIPADLAKTKLSLQRKELIITFINLRIEELKKLISEVQV